MKSKTKKAKRCEWIATVENLDKGDTFRIADPAARFAASLVSGVSRTVDRVYDCKDEGRIIVVTTCGRTYAMLKTTEIIIEKGA
jgi:hypothetical protein